MYKESALRMFQKSNNARQIYAYEKGRGYSPVCANTWRLGRTVHNAFSMGGDLNARNSTIYILCRAE